MVTRTDIAVVGAGPYGLSLAAHLAAEKPEMQVFGKTMQFWRESMPEGMVLKSEGFASTLYDPAGSLTLEAYCHRNGLPYAHTGLPVPLETFIAYGQAFQRRFVPDVKEERVNSVQTGPAGFVLQCEDGQVTTARRVVVAAGIQNFPFIPANLAPLAGPHLSHASAHRCLSGFAGRRVLVIGGGASGIELAALLHQAAALVKVAVRHDRIAYCNPPEPRTVWNRLQAPLSGLGTGWRSLACVKAPLVFHMLPAAFRAFIAEKHLGPAPGWTSRAGIEGKVDVLLGSEIQSARLRGDEAEVSFRLRNGETRVERADHVIAATGYKIDLQRMNFLDPTLRMMIRCHDRSPELSRNFESSVPGLFFIGPVATNSFGPMLRFAYGAGYVARRLSRHLLARQPRNRDEFVPAAVAESLPVRSGSQRQPEQADA